MLKWALHGIFSRWTAAIQPYRAAALSFPLPNRKAKSSIAIATNPLAILYARL